MRRCIPRNRNIAAISFSIRSKWHGVAAAGRAVLLASATPYFLGEAASATLRRRTNHVDRVGYAHRIGFALHRENGGHPLPKCLRAASRRVVLTRLSTEAGASERIRAQYVVPTAGPNKICRRVILLVAVNVPDFDVSPRSAQAAPARARRGPGVRTVTQCTIRDLFRAHPPTYRPAGAVLVRARVLRPNPAGLRQS